MKKKSEGLFLFDRYGNDNIFQMLPGMTGKGG